MSDLDDNAPAVDTSQDREEEVKVEADEGYNPDFEDAPVPAGTILPPEQHS